MKIKNKKKLALLISISCVLVVSIVVGSVIFVITNGGNGAATNGDDKRELYQDDSAAAYVETFVPEFTTKSVSLNDIKDYVIVYPASSDELKESANKLQKYFSEKLNAQLNVVSDKITSVKKEILVGNTNRKIGKFDSADGEFSVSVLGEKLVFEGSHYVSVNKAVDAFVSLDYKDGYINTLSGSFDFNSKLDNGYEYVWGDEFDGSFLDPSKWGKDVSGDSTATMRFLDEECIKVEDGRLKLYALHYFDASDPNVEYAVPYSITTANTMAFKYGYLEMRARIPYSVGAWPAFWLGTEHAIGNHTKLDYEIEVDIFEVFASLDTLRPNLHKWYDSSNHSQMTSSKFGVKSFTFEKPENLNKEYHIYGFEWTQEKMIMYVDGKAYNTFDITKSFDDIDDIRGCHNPMRILLSHHLFTDDAKFKPFAGCTIDPRNLPLEFFVDYIRLYQKPEVSALYTAD